MDSHQLPPIRPSDDSLFRDKNSPTFDVHYQVELKERMRQSSDSPIIPVTDVYADAIEAIDNRESYPDNPLLHNLRVTNYDRESDEGVIFTNNRERAINNLAMDFKRPEAKNDINYARGLVYTNSARNEINRKVRKIVFGENLSQYEVGEIVISFSTYALPSGKVITHNSDMYKVIAVREGKHRKGYKLLKLTLETISGTNIEVPVIHRDSLNDFNKTTQEYLSMRMYKKYYDLLGTVANIQYAYAITSHKSQGSTYRNAYVFEDNILKVGATTPKTKFQSMYVATSRPKKKLVMISTFNTN